MAVQWSDTLRNATLNTWETTIGTSAKVRIYAGTPPANETTGLATGNTLLVNWDLASDWAGNATGGVKTLSNTPVSGTATGAGSATFYRIWNSAGTTCHEQGTVATSAADMTIDNASITAGQTVRITSWTKTAPH